MSSYKDYFEFQKKINQLESNLMIELSDKIKYVGISIQLYQELQDDYSPTREHTTAINCYCKSVQQTDKIKCNLFDIEAKKYYKEYTLPEKIELTRNGPAPLLCSCHANVTNLLFLFNPLDINKYKNFTYDNKGINLYIFIGHLLLRDYPSIDIIEDQLYTYDISDGYIFTNINEFDNFTNEINSSIYNKEKCDKDITVSTYTTLREVKLAIQKELCSFLEKEKYISISENSIVVNDKLKDLDDIPSLNKISDLIIEVDRYIKEMKSVDYNQKIRFNEIKKEISYRIKKTKALLKNIKSKVKGIESDFSEIDSLFIDYKLDEIYKWLKEGLEKNMGLKKWFNEFEKNIK